MQLDELTFWRQRRQTLIALKSRDPLGGNWDEDLRDCERELAQLQPPTPKPAPKPVTHGDLTKHTESLIQEIAPVIRNYVVDAVAPLLARIEALEAHPIKYCGVFEPGRAYAKNAVCTHNGSMFIALDSPVQPPGDTSDWQLCCKRGRDGKDAGR